MEAIAKGVRGDDVAGEGFEDRVNLQDLALFARSFVPAREHFLNVFFDNGFDAADAGAGEETIDAVPAVTVGVVVDGGDDGVGSWKGYIISSKMGSRERKAHSRFFVQQSLACRSSCLWLGTVYR